MEEENDVERKIFADTALQSLCALSAGLLEDGDGKRNETVAVDAVALANSAGAKYNTNRPKGKLDSTQVRMIDR